MILTYRGKFTVRDLLESAMRQNNINDTSMDLSKSSVAAEIEISYLLNTIQPTNVNREDEMLIAHISFNKNSNKMELCVADSTTEFKTTTTIIPEDCAGLAAQLLNKAV